MGLADCEEVRPSLLSAGERPKKSLVIGPFRPRLLFLFHFRAHGEANPLPTS